MKNPIITVIVPVYNVDRYLRQCMDSLMSQTMTSLEILCVNDGSTDRSLEILQEYEKFNNNVKIIDKVNAGYGAAINSALKSANGNYIGIVEPDDFIDSHMYESLYHAAISHNMPDIVKAGYWDYFDHGEESSIKIQLGLKVPDGTVFSIYEHPELLRIHPSVWSCIYSKEFLTSHNIQMIEAKGAGWVDNPFFFETMCQAKRICWHNKPVYYYRQTSYNSSSSLKDCSIPICRINEILNFLEAKHITDIRIQKELYKRALLYISKIENNPNYNSHNKKETRLLLNRLDSDIVSQLTASEIQIYKRNKNSLSVIGHLKAVVMKGAPDSTIYKIARRVYRVGKYYKSNGMQATCKRLTDEFFPHHSIVLPPKSTMRILFIASDNNRTSGAFLSMVTLNQILREKYHIDTFVIIPNHGNGEQLLKDRNIPYTLIESRDWVVPIDTVHDDNFTRMVAEKEKINSIAIQKIKRFIQENKVDIVHINTSYSYVGAIAALKAKTPYIWHLREFLEEDQGNTLWDRNQGNKLIGQASKVIAISRSIYQKYQNILPPNKLICIFNGIDSKKFYKPQKEILQDDTVRLVLIGGFEVYKGHIEFAKACRNLYESGTHNIEIWFIGTGKKEVRDQVEQILSTNFLKTHSHYLGYKNDVYNYLDQTDISFTCSKAEAFGRTTVEAMLSGNLVIGANTAGTRDLIDDGETGLLYEQGNPDDLCQKILFAIEHRDISSKIAAQGRQYMFEHMTAEINAKNILNVYSSILNS